MKLILASEFDVSFHKTKEIIKSANGNKVVFIPTACYGEGFEPSYKEHIQPFEDMGMQVVSFDLKGKSEQEVEEVIADAALIYGGPGNTFYLLEHMNNCNFQKLLERKLDQGCIYLGSSAGSIVASPDIGFISPMDDPSRANLQDTTGLNFIDFLFLPHLDHPEMGEDAKTIIRQHDCKSQTLLALNDDQAVFVNNKVVQVI